MLIPVIICVVCLFAGAAAGARWLPELAPGPVGGMALCAVCGLLGMALAVVGLHIYWIVEMEGGGERFAHIDLASQLSSMFTDAGPLIGLALVAYLLAPEPEEADAPSAPPPVQSRA